MKTIPAIIGQSVRILGAYNSSRSSLEIRLEENRTSDVFQGSVWSLSQARLTPKFSPALFGLAVFIAVLYATSHNRKAVNWHTVIAGMLVSIIWSSITLCYQDLSLRTIHQEQKPVQWLRSIPFADTGLYVGPIYHSALRLKIRCRI